MTSLDRFQDHCFSSLLFFNQGVPSFGRQLYCLSGRRLSIILCIRTIVLMRRLKEEQWWNLSDSSSFGKFCSVTLVDSVVAESFLTSASEESNSKSSWSLEGGLTCCQRKEGPLNQRSLPNSSFAVIPREASLAGFSFPVM